MRILRYISCFLLAFGLSCYSYGQSWTGQAYEFYQAKDFENAKMAIDSAVTTIERFDSQTWQLRGLIYRNISTDDQIYYREISLESFVFAKKVDSAGVYTDKINHYIKSTVVRYYNDAVILLNEERAFDKSEESYNTYKKKYKTLLDPSFDFRESDIAYYNAIGAAYLEKAELVEPKNKAPLREKAIEYCQKVTEIDSLDYKANFNSGIVYYNIGVDLIVHTDPEITIEQLILNQKHSEEAFLNALPFLKRAEKLRPDSKEVKEALTGCYRGLNNNELYLKYQTELDRENLPIYLKRYETHPTDVENVKQIVRVYTYTMPNEEEKARFRKVLDDLNKR